jgi:hypothetical protein
VPGNQSDRDQVGRRRSFATFPRSDATSFVQPRYQQRVFIPVKTATLEFSLKISNENPYARVRSAFWTTLNCGGAGRYGQSRLVERARP